MPDRGQSIRGRAGPFRTAVRSRVPPDTGVVLSELMPYPRTVVYSRAPAAWTPLSLPGLLGWWDTSDPASITSSSGLVSQLNDKSGNGRHVLQANATYQPSTGVDNIGGLNALKYGPHLLQTAGNITQAQPITVLAVVKATTITGIREILCSVTSNATLYHDGTFRIYGGTAVGTQAVDSNPHVLSAVLNGASSAIWVDGTAAGTGNAGASAFSAEKLAFGAQPTAGTSTPASGTEWLGDIAEVIFCSGALGTTDRQTAENYLKAKWLPTGGGVLTVTDRGEDFALAASITSHFSGAVPTAGRYLVTVFGGWDTSNVGTPPTVSDNFADTGGGAWQYVYDQLHNFGSSTYHQRCAWRKYGTGGTSGGEITVTGWSGTPDYLGMGVWEVGGANPTNPIKQYVNAETSLTTVTNTLPAALATTNSMVITGYTDVGQDTYNPVAETGYTLEFHDNMGGDGFVCHFKVGSADQVTHFNTTPLESATPNMGFAVEIW